jgi:hypothetical protein
LTPSSSLGWIAIDADTSLEEGRNPHHYHRAWMPNDHNDDPAYREEPQNDETQPTPGLSPQTTTRAQKRGKDRAMVPPSRQMVRETNEARTSSPLG